MCADRGPTFHPCCICLPLTDSLMSAMGWRPSSRANPMRRDKQATLTNWGSGWWSARVGTHSRCGS